MQREKSIAAARFVRSTQRMMGMICFFLLTGALLSGENEATRELVRRIAVDDAELWKESPKIYASIAADSTFKPVASQAMALIHIRQGSYSEAWKLLSAQSKDLSSMHVAYRLGHEKLMLWLWLQAGAAAQAEAQFKRLVTAAINKELPDPERRDICYFLGSVIGMLQSSGETSCIAAATLEVGRTSLEKLESKISVEQFRTGLKSSTEWQQSLQAKLSEFNQLDPEKAASVLSALAQDSDSKSAALTQLRPEIKNENADKSRLNEERAKLVKNQKVLINAWNTPTPGYPVKPKEPHRPSMPIKDYEKIYSTDPKTGQRTATGEKETAASKQASEKYYSDMRTFDQRLRQFQIAAQTYPARLAAWTQANANRLSSLQESKKRIDSELASKISLIEDVEERVKEKLASSKSLANELRLSKATIAIATIAKQLTESKSPVPVSIARPSHFELLEWESEVYRLEKCLRETGR